MQERPDLASKHLLTERASLCCRPQSSANPLHPCSPPWELITSSLTRPASQGAA